VAKYHIERRKCRRFEIPGGEVKYKKIGLFSFQKDFSEACPVVNVSMGGLSFVCDGRFGRGKKVVVQLLVPKEKPLHLYGRVRWQGQWAGNSTFRVTDVEFMPFGTRRGCNPLEALNVLRRLDAHYDKEG